MPSSSTMAPKVPSKKFNATDADIIFKSSDNILFHIHRKNLEVNTGAFPPREFSTRGEIVELPEDASTLNHIFEYIYPRRHSELEKISAPAIFAIAEGAEKYEVYGLMVICKLRIMQLVEKHPMETFKYAFQHDYKDLMTLAAPNVLDCSVHQLLTLLPSHLVLPMIRYREHFNRVSRDIVTDLHPQAGVCDYCDSPARVELFWFELDDKRSPRTLQSLVRRIYECTEVECHRCGRPIEMPNSYITMPNYLDILERRLNDIPKFDTFYV